MLRVPALLMTAASSVLLAPALAAEAPAAKPPWQRLLQGQDAR
jgi:hypothetical protein